MGRWNRIAGRSFLEWLSMPEGLRWLDVGCGTGAFTDLIAQSSQPADIIGIDPSSEHRGQVLNSG
jgi:ubiquinone/menaquinone biosynthesis C-methylase UbiE